MEFKGKIAIVTGASSGIGKAVALRFAKEGATVAAIARRKNKLEELSQNDGSGRVHALSGIRNNKLR